jgi:hypothetical protein
MTLRQIMNKYPTTNDEWTYMCVSRDVGDYYNGLTSFLHNVLFGSKSTMKYKSDEYVGVNEFFVRLALKDDFYDNPDVFTSNTNDLFHYSGNSDPWGRKFKVYKSWFNVTTMNGYKCDAILNHVGKPLVYILNTSVEGHTIYCVDRINI